jgi:histone acetyltransferase
VPDFTALPDREKAFKVARFVSCTAKGCDCSGLVPPEDTEIVLVSREQMIMEGGYKGSGMTGEGWWSTCGICGHGWEGDSGHVFPAGLAKEEKVRRGRAVGRIEELLQVSRALVVGWTGAHMPRMRTS